MLGDEISCQKTNLLLDSAEADGHGRVSMYIHMVTCNIGGGGRSRSRAGLATQCTSTSPTCFLCILRICSEPANSLPLRQDRLSNSEPALHRTSLGGLSETTCLLTVRSEVNYPTASRQMEINLAPFVAVWGPRWDIMIKVSSTFLVG